MKQHGYIYEIHFLRALACLLVLTVHLSTQFYYGQGGFTPYMYALNQLSRFGTPIFAVISGFLLFYQVRRKGFQLQPFLTSRFSKVGIPFLAWSLLYYAFRYYFLQHDPFQDGGQQLLIGLLFGHAYYHLYFISITFQFYLLFPFLQRFRNRRSWIMLLFLAILTTIYFEKMAFPWQYSGLWQFLLSQRAFLPRWIFYFIFGGFLAYYWEPLYQWAKKYRKLLAALVVIALLLAIYECQIVGRLTATRITNLLNIPIFTLFILGMGKPILARKWLNRFLMRIGRYSMAIYFIHPLVLYAFRTFAPSEIWRAAFFPLIFIIILEGTILMIKLLQALPFSHYLLTIPKVPVPVKPVKRPPPISSEH